MKDFAGRLPDAANILKPKNDQENLPTSLGSGIAFVNYSDSSDARSGNFNSKLPVLSLHTGH